MGNLVDLMGQPIDIGDDVVFSYYKGSGMLYVGKIFSIGKTKIIVKSYFYDSVTHKRLYDIGRRMIPIDSCKHYLLKINKND